MYIITYSQKLTMDSVGPIKTPMERSYRSREDTPELPENHKCHIDVPSFLTELSGL